MLYRPPELPKVQKMPRKRPAKQSGMVGRAVAGLAGVAFGLSGVMSLLKALRDSSGQSSPFMAAAALLPAVMLVRYAITGQLKLS